MTRVPYFDVQWKEATKCSRIAAITVCPEPSTQRQASLRISNSIAAGSCISQRSGTQQRPLHASLPSEYFVGVRVHRGLGTACTTVRWAAVAGLKCHTAETSGHSCAPQSLCQQSRRSTHEHRHAPAMPCAVAASQRFCTAEATAHISSHSGMTFSGSACLLMQMATM